MADLRKLIWVELKLFRRDLGAAFFPLIIPLFVLVIFGISFDLTDSSLPAVSVALALALQAFYNLPGGLANYRESGVLRRLATTPVHPGKLLAAQLIVHLLATALSAALVSGVAVLLFKIPAPRSILEFLGVFFAGLLAMFAIGLLIAALAPNGRAATGTGVLLYFPLAFLGGLTVPYEQMPPLLALLGDFTPLGAFRHALYNSWSGNPLDPLGLVIMGLYAGIAGFAAVRLFRWQ